MQNFRSLGAPPPDPQSSSLIANFWQRACSVYADGYAGESLINTIFDAGKTKRAFYVINLN